jgi:hypothetical protein
VRSSHSQFARAISANCAHLTGDATTLMGNATTRECTSRRSGFPDVRRRTHKRLQREVTAYVDGELAPRARARVKRHLQDCWWCSIDAEFARLIKWSLSHQRHRHLTDLSAARLRRWASP